MSEAESPNDQPASDPIEPSEHRTAAHAAAADAVNPADSEGWQTVDFPGAMSIDALPQSPSVPPHPLSAVGEMNHAGVIHYSTAEIDPTITPLTAIPAESNEAAIQLQLLQEENAALRDRLTQAELDLIQHQMEWQRESACLSQAKTAADKVVEPTVWGHPVPVEPTNESVQQLVQELERSQQTAQRQQILVETLTGQLESSQERIAQLERDCALTQQRHNEQVQQVLQAENTCRDLRLRLHRQQQQTLQFKAALEKSLEMPTAYSHQVPPGTALDDPTTEPQPLSALLKSKNQPVKPWSQPAETTQTDLGTQPELPKPLFKLLNHGLAEQSHTDLLPERDGLMAAFAPPFAEAHPAQANTILADPSALLDSDDPQFVTHLMQLIFPDAAETLSYTSTDALEADVSQAASLDVSPFLRTAPTSADASPAAERLRQTPRTPEPSIAELAAPAALTGVNPQEGVEAKPSKAEAIAPGAALTLPDDPSADPLWDGLATLIDPPSSVASTEAVAVVEEDDCPDAPVVQPRLRTEHVGIPPISTPRAAGPGDAVSLKSPTSQTASPLTTWTWRDRLSSSNQASRAPMAERAATEKEVPERTLQSPSKLLALSTLDRQTPVTQTVSVSSATAGASTPFSSTMPSPIVYPHRSSKKLASLAAVDLPTFPKP